MTEHPEFIDPTVPPSGNGCVECEAAGGWWVHLRRCALCGHVGCCDDSLETHATKHFEATGHPVVRSYEPGEDWFWDYLTHDFSFGPRLAPPTSHPADQSAPGPAERLPEDWQELLAAKRGED
ncbi:MAG TPA: UBP-type zinc finger domain-containing protein [Microbacterium sp.]|nr:UBP-type zinc finger domain-containing protein [Microbacterium sp.]